MLTYLLKVCINILLFYGLYKLLLQYSRFFVLNRVYLIVTTLLAFLVPLLQVPAPVEIAMITGRLAEVRVGQDLLLRAGAEPRYWLLWLYQAGCVVSIFYSLAGIAVALKAVRRPTVVDADPGYHSYSFFGRIYIPQQQNKNGTILAHEMAHVKQWHSLDVLFFEMVKCILWFFPVVYLLRKEIRQVHEYLADEAACAGNDKALYCEMLLAGNLQLPEFSLTNSFYQPSIKKRIMMIVQQNTKRISPWRYICLLPAMLLCVMLTAPADQLLAQKPAMQKEKPEKIAEYKEGTAAMMKFMGENIRYPEAAKKNKQEGKAVFSLTISAKGELAKVQLLKSSGNKEMDAEALRVVKMLKEWNPAEAKGKNVSCDLVLPVAFKLS